MKSTTGAHYVALDHIRAMAVLLVFVWHFMHAGNGSPVPFQTTSIWGPLVIFDEGHVGVALFMTLSGYLFAKLLDGKRIIYHLFFWNRILRLFPLLLLVILINAAISIVESGDYRAAYWYLLKLPRGFVFPTWPNGGWSITAELHFYLVLPALLFMRKRLPGSLAAVVLIALCLRAYLYAINGEVQSAAYWTLIGRIDQFVLGIMAFHGRSYFTGRHVLAFIIFIAFLTIYYWFSLNGGFRPLHPSSSRIWIVLSTIEGMTAASLIAWYETSFLTTSGMISTFLSKIGEYSYSIYLLHFFFVFRAAQFINGRVIDISSLDVALPVSILLFFAMTPIGYLSMKYIEAPFLRLRRQYYTSSE